VPSSVTLSGSRSVAASAIRAGPSLGSNAIQAGARSSRARSTAARRVPAIGASPLSES
jgi:hypothetical protein